MAEPWLIPESHREQARQAVLHGLAVVQAVERHGSQGRPFLDALAGWQVSLLELANRTGMPLELRLVEDTVWVGSRLLVADPRTTDAVGHLQARLRQRGVGGLRWQSPPSVDILRHWILRFGQPLHHPSDGGRIRATLEELRPYGLETLDPRFPSAEELPLIRHYGLKFGRGALARAAVAFAGFINQICDGRDPFTFPIGLTRPIMDMVDLARRAPENLAWVLAGRREQALSLHEALGGYAPVHAAATAAYAILLGTGLRLSSLELLDLGVSALLSKVAYALVPPELTERAGPLTPEDRYSMQLATVRAVQYLLASSRFGEPTLRRLIVAYEHQRPYALANGQHTGSHVYARIVSVADAFDALTAPRPWRSGHRVGEAIAELRTASGTKYDPVFVEAIDGLTRNTAL